MSAITVERLREFKVEYEGEKNSAIEGFDMAKLWAKGKASEDSEWDDVCRAEGAIALLDRLIAEAEGK